MKVVICEDEQYWQKALEAAISRWAAAREVGIECQCVWSPKELVDCLKARKDIDVLFLDISLGDTVTDGMTLAKHLRKVGITTPLIFVTVDSFRAADGYLVEAMGYLSKPIDESRLKLFMDKIIRRKKLHKTINLVVEGHVTKIKENEILYAEVINHTVTYHTLYGNFNLRSTLTEVLATLDKDCFIQIHRSYVIALDKIHSIKTTYPYSVDLRKIDVTANLPVSRNFINKLILSYSDEVMEKMK